MKYEILQNQTASNKNGKNLRVLQPSWTLGEITLPASTLEQIEEMVAYIRYREKLLNEWCFARFLKNSGGLIVNFYGLPGTGKSITTEALANLLQMSIIKVNYGELQSELMGGTSSNLNSLFQEAEETNSMLIFDEADALVSPRISRLSQAADHDINAVKSTLLTLLDRTRNVVVFTTNFFGQYDPSVLRRILFNIEFLPPDNSMRKKLWEFHLSTNIPKSISYERLAEISDGLCGGDIRNLTLKLGLKLLLGKASELNEMIVQSEIDRYLTTKNRHQELNNTIAVNSQLTDEKNVKLNQTQIEE
ncbi:AAA family ATPase [Phormidium sp. LEGE 05292]|uniref:ATP-binding protein n=1 Tax=[Phormidium] sp. LEGE 05292 TaxID=767427 RepID=UPI001881059A|nr:ATP-binding protein [Phormidium sp. LEGE 05292]MBE9224102.1 AAA family ATPase [Phormidium sp. LEGE 05292]